MGDQIAKAKHERTQQSTFLYLVIATEMNNPQENSSLCVIVHSSKPISQKAETATFFSCHILLGVVRAAVFLLKQIGN